MSHQSKKLKLEQEIEKNRSKQKGQALLEYVLILSMCVTAFYVLLRIMTGDKGVTDNILDLFAEKISLISFVLSIPY